MRIQSEVNTTVFLGLFDGSFVMAVIGVGMQMYDPEHLYVNNL